MRISTLFRGARTIVRAEGVKSLYVRTRNRLARARDAGNLLGVIGMLKKINVIEFYDFVLKKNAGVLPSTTTSINKKTINWIIPDFGIGSGGHLNIFRYIFMLEKLGYENKICLDGNHTRSSPEQARILISEHFFPLKAEVVFGIENLTPAYFSFATGWMSAYSLKGFGNTVHKLYFVQDFEPHFYSHGSEYDFAEETYKFGFLGVCAGNWLAKKLAHDYGMQTHALGFSFDRELYIQTPRREPNIRRVFCYCRPPTLRRGLETALLALHLVGNEMPEVKFIFAGWDMGDYYFPHEHLNAGVLSLKELPDLYSQCDVGLVISFTNLSLLPLELMACGTAVVSNRGQNTEWLLNDLNSVLPDSSPEAISEAIVSILKDRDLRIKLTTRAKTFALSTNWESEADRLQDILNNLIITDQKEM